MSGVRVPHRPLLNAINDKDLRQQRCGYDWLATIWATILPGQPPARLDSTLPPSRGWAASCAALYGTLTLGVGVSVTQILAISVSLMPGEELLKRGGKQREKRMPLWFLSCLRAAYFVSFKRS